VMLVVVSNGFREGRKNEKGRNLLTYCGFCAAKRYQVSSEDDKWCYQVLDQASVT